MCSWYEASTRATQGETCADQITDSFQAHKNVMQFLSQAHAMRSALVKRLYCAVCAVFIGVLSTSSNKFAIAKSATAKLKMKMKMLPAGIPVALFDTAIQSCDRHRNRSFLLLRILSLTLLTLWMYRYQRLFCLRQMSILHCPALF